MYWQVGKSAVFAFMNQMLPLLVMFGFGVKTTQNYNLAVLVCNYVYQLMVPSLIYASRDIQDGERLAVSNIFAYSFLALCGPLLLFFNVGTHQLLVLVGMFGFSFYASKLAIRIHGLEAQLNDITAGAKFEIFGAVAQIVVLMCIVGSGFDFITAFCIGFVARYAVLMFLTRRIALPPMYAINSFAEILRLLQRQRFLVALLISHVAAFYSVAYPFVIASNSLQGVQNGVYNVLMTLFALPPLVVISLRRFLYYRSFDQRLIWSKILISLVILLVGIAVSLRIAHPLFEFALDSTYDFAHVIGILSVICLLTTGVQLNILEHIDAHRARLFLIVNWAPALMYTFALRFVDSPGMTSIVELNLVGVAIAFFVSHRQIQGGVKRLFAYSGGALVILAANFL